MHTEPSNNQRIRLTRPFKEKELGLLILLVLLYFYRPLFMGETFFFRDLYLHDLPDKQLFVDFMHAKELPLWEPYKHGGRPYLANIILFTLYPGNLLYFLLPILRAFNLTIVLHFIFCAVFAYLFSRVIGLRPVSSLICGVVYSFCGYVLSLANILNRILAMPYIPLLLLFWHLLLLERQRKWFAATVIVGGIQVFTGAPETNVITLLFLLGWSFVYPYASISIRRKITLWLLTGIFILGIASVQLVPTVELVSFSARGQGMAYAAFSRWSLHPKRLTEIIFPGLLGYLDRFPWDRHYWGKPLVDPNSPYILSMYFGGATILLACFGGKRHRYDMPGLPLKVRRFLLFLSIAALVFAMGRFLPFFHVLYRYFPLIRIFRYPIKFLIAGIFPLALLAAYTSEVHFHSRGKEEEYSPLEGGQGLSGVGFLVAQSSKTPPAPLKGGNSDFETHDDFFDHPERSIPPLRGAGGCKHSPSRKNLPLKGGQGEGDRPSKGFVIGLWSGAALLLVFVILFRFSANFAHPLLEMWFGPVNGDIARQSLNNTFVHTAAIWLLLTLLYQYRRIRRKNWQHWLLAGILILDLFIAGKRVNFYAPEDFFTAIPPIIPTVQHERGEGRLFRDENPASVTIRYAPSDHIMWGDRWNLEVLGGYTASLYRIPVIFHEDVERLASVYVGKLKSLLDTLPWEKRLPFLSAGNVTVIVTSEAIAVPGIELITEIPNRSNVMFYLYKNTAAANRVEFVRHGQFVKSDRDALALMLRSDYDPRKHVVLQEAEASGLFPFFKNTQREQQETAIIITPTHVGNIGGNAQQCETTQINAINKNIHASHFSVINRCDGYLVFSEPFYPGWDVSIDGTSTSILRANYAFSAIFLEAGEHEVERRYRPNSLLLGVISSLIFGGIFACLVYKKWF